MIEAKNIYKSFKDQHILKDVSVLFEAGKTNLIIGQSGSGKTVLLKCLVGLYEVDKGDIFFNNRNFSKMKLNERIEIRKELGMLFQGGALFDYMTVEENVMFPLQMFSKNTKKENQQRAAFCLERVNLSHAAKLHPAELSGGMQKRAAIARAISLNPKYLFCDEPNSGLDPKTGVLIDELIRELTLEFKMTTIINTHDMNSVLALGDTINFVFEGKIEWKGTKDNFLSTSNQKLQEFIYSTEVLKRLKP